MFVKHPKNVDFETQAKWGGNYKKGCLEGFRKCL